MKRQLFILPLLLLVQIIGFAQKLPVKQEESVWAPPNIRVDGKGDEWGNQFKAHNTATDLFYTLSNDDKYLYLTVQATNADNINKLYSTGLVFEVNKKKDKQMVSLTYPVFAPGKENQFMANIKVKPAIDSNSKQGILRADSFMNVVNQQMTAKAKWIKASGIKGLDTISVYNEDGIKAASMFNNQMVYTLEMALPLKYIGVKPGEVAELNYHIQLNPIRSGGWNNLQTEKVMRNGREVTHVMGMITNDTIDIVHNMNSVTDLRGDYILSTKGK